MEDDNSEGVKKDNVVKGPWKRIKLVSKSQSQKITEDMLWVDELCESIMIPMIHRLAENNIDVIKSIVKNKSAKNIKMKDGSLKMDMFTASAIMNVYNKVNPTNKKKMEDLANGKKSDLMKLQSLAMKFVK